MLLASSQQVYFLQELHLTPCLSPTQNQKEDRAGRVGALITSVRLITKLQHKETQYRCRMYSTSKIHFQFCQEPQQFQQDGGELSNLFLLQGVKYCQRLLASQRRTGYQVFSVTALTAAILTQVRNAKPLKMVIGLLVLGNKDCGLSKN